MRLLNILLLSSDFCGALNSSAGTVTMSVVVVGAVVVVATIASVVVPTSGVSSVQVPSWKITKESLSSQPQK